MAAHWQQYATEPAAVFTVTDDEGAAVDLSDKTVAFRFARPGQIASWERSCTVDPAVTNRCTYQWQAGDLGASGDFEGQLVITYAGGTKDLSEVFPILVERSIAPLPA